MRDVKSAASREPQKATCRAEWSSHDLKRMRRAMFIAVACVGLAIVEMTGTAWARALRLG